MSPTLVCLHGWGGTKDSFTELKSALAGSGIAVFAPDLPGFGSEPEPPTPWTIDDYADWAAAYIKNNVHGSYQLLGHSHGGRIAIRLATRSKAGDPPLPDHLYLCAAAGIRHARHIKRIIGLTLAKGGKLLLSIPGLRRLQPAAQKLLYRLVRVHDYEKASPVMRQTLINVSREDLSPVLHTIGIPADIFWGERDSMTPLADGRKMAADIPDSTLHTYPETRHRVHRDRANEIAVVVRRRFGL